MTFKEAVTSDFKEVLSTTAGKRVIGGILRRSLFYEGTYAAGQFDLSAYREGMRAVGLMTANTIREIDPRLIGECETEYEKLRGIFDELRQEEDDE